MARYTHKKKEEIGLSPNALVLRGIRRMEHPALRLTDYSGDEVIERACPLDADLSALAAPGRFIWLNVSGLHDAALMQRIGGTLGIPLHVLSDIMDTGVRPKAEEFDGGLFITLKSLRYGKRGGRVSADSVSLVLLGDLLLSFQEEEDGLFDPVRARLRKSPAKMREAGSDYLAFALLDVVIDHYLYVAGEMGERIERLEDRLYDRSGGGTDRDLLGQTVRYKRELSLLRKHVHPAREVTVQLAKSDADCLHTANRAHFHELLRPDCARVLAVEFHILGGHRLRHDYRYVFLRGFRSGEPDYEHYEGDDCRSYDCPEFPAGLSDLEYNVFGLVVKAAVCFLQK